MKTAKQIIQSIIDQGIVGFLDFGELIISGIEKGVKYCQIICN